jgi:sulfur-carrier protein adenylyltransferase/sulfurtransferase
MTVKINLLASLLKFTGGDQGIEVEGNTVGQCIDRFVEKYPASGPALFDQNARIRGYIDIYVNGQNAFPEMLDSPVKDRDEIYLSIAIRGG